MKVDKDEFEKKINESKKLFPKRLQQAMDLRNMRAVELSEKTGIDKSKISSYLAGRFRAKQDGIFKLSQALSVDPAWLMGLDVPITQESSIEMLFVIQDDSMYPLVNKGDIATIRKTDTYENGKTYLLKYDNKEIIRKIQDNGNNIELHSMNPYYPIINTSKDKIEIIGKVIKVENESAFK